MSKSVYISLIIIQAKLKSVWQRLTAAVFQHTQDVSSEFFMSLSGVVAMRTRQTTFLLVTSPNIQLFTD